MVQMLASVLLRSRATTCTPRISSNQGAYQPFTSCILQQPMFAGCLRSLVAQQCR